MGRLNFIRHNQKRLRADLYKGVVDASLSGTSSNTSDVGKAFILPATFSGSPRHMEQLCQDAMASMRAHGKPDAFVTFTTNPKWPEITDELESWQDSNDRPDLISRVFNLKLKALMRDILEFHVLGRTVAHIYVIEWQKRGLPHAHILICFDEESKIKTIKQVDAFVSAEIPDINKHKLAYETVSACLMHGPCGPAFPDSPCMKDGKCSKHFPKPLCEETRLAK